LALLGTGSGALLVYFGGPLDQEQIEFVPQKIGDPNTRLARENLSFLERATMLQKNPELFKSWKLYGAIPIAFFPFLLDGYLQAIILRSAPEKFGQM
jgi:hypothetical protein